MNNRYLSIDLIKNNNSNDSLDLRNNNLIETSLNPDKNLNILKYLTALEKNNTIKEKKKFNLKILPPLNPKFQIYKQNNLSRSISIKNNLKFPKNDGNSISNSNDDDGCFITSLEIVKNEFKNNNSNIINQKNKTIKNKLKQRLYEINRNNRNYNNKFRLASIIKAIKRKNSSYISKTEGNDFNEYLAYDNKNMNYILDINNIINNHIKNEDWNLKAREEKYNDFVDIKKEVCRNNVMIKLINQEKDKIKNEYKNYSLNFDKQINAVKEGEKIFEKIIGDQKKNTKLIENNYYKLKNDNKVLLYIRESFKEQVKKTEYEIMKKIYEIDELRIYAQFVNYIYGYDTSLYNKSLIDTDYTKKPSEAEALVKNILKNYRHFLKSEKNEIIERMDPDIVLNEIILIEDRILMNLKMRDQEYEYLKKYKLHNKNILKNIEVRKLELENEYNIIKKELDDIIINTKLNLDDDLFLISKDLGIFILDYLSGDKNLLKKFKGNINLFELSDLANKSMELILQKESKLDEYMKIMEKYDKEDKKIFSALLNKRKEEIIRTKIDQAKIDIERKQYLDKIEIYKNNDKIYFIKRKALPTLNKKLKEIIKIDPKIVKLQENKEMISYE